MFKAILFLYLTLFSLVSVASEDIIVHKDVKVCAGLDIAMPKANALYPLIVFIHGGSWMEGDKNWYSKDIEDFARQGVVAATINYKLYSEENYDFSETVEDIKCAVRHLKKAANTYHIDLDKIYLAGDSAGGHLSLLVGLKYQFTFKGLFSYAGPTDIQHLVDTNPKAKGFFEMIMGNKWQIYSPINFVKKSSPDIFVFHGTADELVPFEQALRLQTKASTQNTALTLYPLEGEKHNFSAGAWTDVMAETIQIMKDFKAY